MYGPDPNAFVKWHYDKKKNSIYAMDEIHGHKIRLSDLAAKIKTKGCAHRRTIADSAEPRSIDELYDYGINIIGAKKGPDSVQFGEEWLGELDAIYIDPKRTPEIAKAFEDADYAVDKLGNSLPRLADDNLHPIDATRYAFEDDMKKSGGMIVKRSIAR